jgi:hypothetical protein
MNAVETHQVCIEVKTDYISASCHYYRVRTSCSSHRNTVQTTHDNQEYSSYVQRNQFYASISQHLKNQYHCAIAC